MGSAIKKPSLSEIKTKQSLQKCLVAKCKIKKGDFFTKDNIIAKRTGGIGISPIYYNEVLNNKALKDYFSDEIIEL
jgi:N,N'-diacetyllegionaminate synthase